MGNVSAARQRAREVADESVKVLSAAECGLFPDLSDDELVEVDAEFARIAGRICKQAQRAAAQKGGA